MTTVVTVIHIFTCIFLMLTVLLQAGKGGGMGAAFGGGSSSGTVFGGSGAGGFLRKLTVGSAAMFMVTSMTLAYLSSASGADALKQYSAQQRRAAQLKEQARDEVLDSDKPDLPNGEEGLIETPDGEEGLIETPDGEEGTDTPDGEEGATDTPDGEATEGATNTPNEGAAGTKPAAAPADDPAGDDDPTDSDFDSE